MFLFSNGDDDSSFDEHECETSYLPDEALDFMCAYASAVINQAEQDGVLFQMITEWPASRAAAYSQALLLRHASLNEETE